MVDQVVSNEFLNAARRGDRDQCYACMVHGVDVHTGTLQRDTALHLAASGGHDDVVSLLLNSGASPMSLNDGGETPMHFAAFWGREAAVRVLIKNEGRRAAINVQCSHKGQTPLHRAVLTPRLGPNEMGSLNAWSSSTHQRRSNKRIVSLLLDASADANLFDHEGQTPLALALGSDDENPDRAVIRLLRKAAKQQAGGRAILLRLGFMAQSALLIVVNAMPASSLCDILTDDARRHSIRLPQFIINHNNNNVKATHSPSVADVCDSKEAFRFEHRLLAAAVPAGRLLVTALLWLALVITFYPPRSKAAGGGVDTIIIFGTFVAQALAFARHLDLY